jgi:hypothetical protein
MQCHIKASRIHEETAVSTLYHKVHIRNQVVPVYSLFSSTRGHLEVGCRQIKYVIVESRRHTPQIFLAAACCRHSVELVTEAHTDI